MTPYELIYWAGAIAASAAALAVTVTALVFTVFVLLAFLRSDELDKFESSE